MRPAPILHIPQPCSESWAAMPPAAQGRHCAACRQTVIDFTQKTDAEILALLAGAAGGRTCGRFAAGQLERPLQRAAPAAPMPARWRTWLAAAGAVWAVREGVGTQAPAQAPTELHKLGEVTPRAARAPEKEAALPTPFVLRGVVRDSATHEGLPGVTVLVAHSTTGIATGADGTFELAVPPELRASGSVALRVSSLGYYTETRWVRAAAETGALDIRLRPDTRTLAGEVVIVGGVHVRPWPWHPRAFYYWGKYWLTRPFRRG